MLRLFFRRQHRLPTNHSPLTPTASTSAFFLLYPLARAISGALLSSADADRAGKAGALTAAYLIESCGLSPEDSASVSKKVILSARSKPSSVLNVLKDYGFTSTDITSMVAKLPSLLKFDPDKNLKPKLEFLRDAGYVGTDLPELLTTNPNLLQRNLGRKIMPSVQFLKTILPSFADVTRVLKLTNQSLMPENVPNIEILRKNGFSDDIIVKIILARPRALLRSPERFADVVSKVKEMGMDPGSMMFAHAVFIMAYMSDSTWEKKIAFLKSVGWSDENIASAFRRQPMYIGLSEKELRQKMELFMNKLGWDPDFISARPRHLMISHEKILIPRCAVFDVLLSKGLIKEKTRVASLLRASEEQFLDACVRKFEGGLPHLMDLYKNSGRSAMSVTVKKN